MQRRRDRLIVFGAILAMAAVSALIIATIFDAQRRGRHALERQKVEQIDALAGSMSRRIEAVNASAGFADQFSFRPRDTADQAILMSFQSATARTGTLLIDSGGRITNGTLLLDQSAVGSKLERPGVADALSAGKTAVLPVARGLTTRLPTTAFVLPSLDTDGKLRGALVFESEVSSEAPFNQEVEALGGPSTGEFMFLDAAGSVVASSDPTRIGKRTDDATLLRLPTGFHRSGGEVRVIANVPAAHWRAVFRQDASDFEGGLSRQLQTVALLVIVVGVVVGGLSILALESRLRAAREEQRRLAEINDAREEFISIVSHELRTPVAGVLGFLQTTLDHWDQLEDSERRDTIARASVNARRLQGLTRDVLDVASVEQGQIRYAFGPVDLREETDAAVAAMREQQPERTISLDAANGPVWVQADGDRLLQVFGNLFDNATTSSPAGSPIELTMAVQGHEVVVSLTDHGAGLSDGEADAVFQKFVRGRASGVRGTGLGLYLCREIVTAHGGRIWAEAGDEGGATFWFALPLGAAPATAASAVADSPA
jgi:signal transduction histidine kinase